MRPTSSNPKTFLWSAACAVLLALSSGGCVYRINIQQGNALDEKAVKQLEVGMTRSQVRYLMGTPLASTPFDGDRWDYVYYLKRGHALHVDEQKLTVYFESDKVARIDGLDTLLKKPAAT